MSTSRLRFTISVDDELFEHIQDYRFTHKFESRSDAVSAMLRIAVRAIEQEERFLKGIKDEEM